MGSQSIAVLVFLFTVCTCQLYSSGKSGSNFPTGLENQMICGRQTWMKIYVCDPDKVLGKDDIEASQLDKIIRAIANETRCPCSHYSCSNHPGGYKIGIAIVKKLSDDELTANVDDDQYDQREIQERLMAKNLNEAQKFAQTVKQQWKLGKCGEDVIIFYSQDDKVVYTATGEVAAQKLTKNLIQEIAINARVNGFSRSAFDGMFSIINDYRAVFLNSYKQKTPRTDFQKSGSSITALPSHLVLLILPILGLVRRS